MPKNTPVARCVMKMMQEGKSKPSAMRMCQVSTKTSYATGKKPKSK